MRKIASEINIEENSIERDPITSDNI